MHDLLIRGGLVVDGTGLPGRPADVAVNGGKVTAIGRLAGEAAQRVIDADGLVVAPGIVDAHTHYDPQITWDPLCDTSALHGVTTVAAGNCGFSVAPCRMDDHDYLAQLFARVEGMELRALSQVDWNFSTFGEFLASRPGTLGINLGMYVGHSAIRRWLLGEEAYERAASADEIAAMAAMVDEAMTAGALGFSSSHAPTHLDLADRPVPSRLASLDEVRALADAVGRRGRGSIAYAPGSAVEGIDAADRALLEELAARGGVPVITQGLGGRSKVDAPSKAWEQSRTFLDGSAERGAPVFSLLMTRAFNGTFTLREGSSRYDGVPLWRELMSLDWNAAAASGSPTPAGASGCATRSTIPIPIRRKDPRSRRRSGTSSRSRRPGRRRTGRIVGREVGALARERGDPPRRRHVRAGARRPRRGLSLDERDPGLARAAARGPAAPADDRRASPTAGPISISTTAPNGRRTSWRPGGVKNASGDSRRRSAASPPFRLPCSGSPTAGCFNPAARPTSSSSIRSGWRWAGGARTSTVSPATPRFRSSAVGVRATIVNGRSSSTTACPPRPRPGQVVRPAMTPIGRLG